MKRYAEYKDSGIEWIGEIPNNWELRKLNSIAETITDFVASGSFASLNENVKYLDSEDYAMLVRTVDLSGSTDRNKVFIDKKAYDYLSNSNLFGGELILSNIGSVGNVYYYTPIYKFASLAPNAIMLRMNECTKFYYYWFLAPFANDELKLIGSSAVQLKFNKTQLRALSVIHPPIATQQAIADYLDRKTEGIDSLISDKQMLIDLLHEKRQATISETVTKGLDKTAKMKDSGINYLGIMPEQWTVKNLRYVGTCQNGLSKGGKYFGTGYPFVSYSDVYKNIELPQEVEGLADTSDSERKNCSVVEGDVFFTRTSETVEEVALTSTCMKTIENATFAGFLIRFRPFQNILDKNYSKYYFRSQLHRLFFVKEMNLVTRASLSQELLKELPVLLPNLNEQAEIADYLDHKTSQIDSLISDITEQIERLKEYRQSIISEVVTGKVAV